MSVLFCIPYGPRRVWGMLGVVDRVGLHEGMAKFFERHRQTLSPDIDFLLSIDAVDEVLLEEADIQRLLNIGQHLQDALEDERNGEMLARELAHVEFTAEDILEFAKSLTRLCANALIRKRHIFCTGK